MSPAVNPRVRTREERAGDPLDGLVNLFDLGIVLAVAFMLAALAAIGLDPAQIGQRQSEGRTNRQTGDAVLADDRERVERINLAPGQRVVGRGKRVGTVYRLRDGRTIIVREAERR